MHIRMGVPGYHCCAVTNESCASTLTVLFFFSCAFFFEGRQRPRRFNEKHGALEPKRLLCYATHPPDWPRQTKVSAQCAHSRRHMGRSFFGTCAPSLCCHKSSESSCGGGQSMHIRLRVHVYHCSAATNESCAAST